MFRAVVQQFQPQRVREGAGVLLRRSFGFAEAPDLDPFLLFDDIDSERPEDYLSGFPWHPHRGMETVTYVLSGEVEHGDSMGNRGSIGTGDVQWMTAGGGVVHQEMPVETQGRWRGTQLWVNLPASHKMIPPRYRDIRSADIPEVISSGGSLVRVIAGSFEGTDGPAQDLIVKPTYLDVSVPAGTRFQTPVPAGDTLILYLLEGSGVCVADGESFAAPVALLFDREGDLAVEAGPSGFRFLLLAGKPIGEPVAWRGPIVMNTQTELERAFAEFHNGTFLEQAR